MRRIAVPPEDLVIRRLERLRSEAKLDERLDPPREHIVIKLVDAAPIICDSAVGMLLHRAQHVVENGVEAQVAETELVDRGLELPLGIVPTHRARIIRAHRQVEEAVERL